MEILKNDDRGSLGKFNRSDEAIPTGNLRELNLPGQVIRTKDGIVIKRSLKVIVQETRQQNSQ